MTARTPNDTRGVEAGEHFQLPEPHPGERLLREQGLCAYTGHEGFHVKDSRTREARAQRAEAKALCAACPVLDVCREVIDHVEAPWNIASRVSEGLWAGELPYERERRRKKERQLVAA